MSAPCDMAVRVEHLSKKFASSLKRAMVYGLHDIASRAVVPHRISEEQGEEALRPSEFYSLRDINFTIRQGERVGIVGSNGAGKSTLFSILSGIYGPSEGRVTVRGRLQALIALGAGFHPLLSGRENIFINAAILGMRGRDVNRRIDEIIAFADIGEFIDAPVKNYSSGMLVRLGFAIAVHMDPDIILIDEILAVGDAKFQGKCLSFMKKLVDDGRTVVMVSHHVGHIQQACERVIWLDRGRIVMDGPVNDVLREYSSWALQSLGKAAGGKSTRGTVSTEFITFSYEILGFPDAVALSAVHGGEPLPQIRRGSPLRIGITYQLHTAIHGKLCFWIIIKDALSSLRIAGTLSREGRLLIDARPGDRGRLVVEFPAIPLTEGLYNFDVGVADRSDVGDTATLGKVYEMGTSFIVVGPSHAAPYMVEGIATIDRLPVVEIPWTMTLGDPS